MKTSVQIQLPFWLLSGFSALNFLFLILLLALGYYNRFASDDYGMLYLYKTYGVVGGTRNLYLTWSSSWATFLFVLSLVSLLNFKCGLFFYSLLIVLLFAFIFYWGLRLLAKRYSISCSKAVLLRLGLFFFNAFFFLSFNKGETWFWLTCSVEYLFGLGIFLTGIILIFSEGTRWWQFGLIIICFLYVGGCVLTLLIPAYIILITLLFLNRSFGGVRRKLTFAFFFFFISSLITIFGPGKSGRMLTLPDPQFTTGLAMSVKAFGKTLVHDLPYIAPLSILFAIPWWYLGSLARENGLQIFATTDLRKKLFRVLLLFIALVVVTVFPAAYLLSDIPPYRVLTPVYLGSALCCAIVAFAIGNTWYIPIRKASTICAASIFFLVVFSTYQLFTNVRVAQTYAEAVDKRIDILRSAQKENRFGGLVLEKLPRSGMLYSAEIMPDSLHYNNENLKKGLGLNFYPRVK